MKGLQQIFFSFETDPETGDIVMAADTDDLRKEANSIYEMVGHSHYLPVVMIFGEVSEMERRILIDQVAAYMNGMITDTIQETGRIIGFFGSNKD